MRAPPDRSGTVRILRDEVPVQREPEVESMLAYLGTKAIIQSVTPADGIWRITMTKADYDALVAAGGRHTRELPLADGVVSVEIIGP